MRRNFSKDRKMLVGQEIVHRQHKLLGRTKHQTIGHIQPELAHILKFTKTRKCKNYGRHYQSYLQISSNELLYSLFFTLIQRNKSPTQQYTRAVLQNISEHKRVCGWTGCRVGSEVWMWRCLFHSIDHALVSLRFRYCTPCKHTAEHLVSQTTNNSISSNNNSPTHYHE